VSFSSARTTKRFPSPRCASAIQTGCPLGIPRDVSKRHAKSILLGYCISAITRITCARAELDMILPSDCGITFAGEKIFSR
jgi:hypothetical protein